MSINTPLFFSTDVHLTTFDHDNDPAIEALWSADQGFARMVSAGPMKPVAASQIKKKYEGLEKRAEEDKDLFYYQARLVKDDRLIGFGLIEWISWTNRSAQLSLGIGLEVDRHQGYGGQILTLLVNFCFYELNLRKLTAFIPAFNQPAISLFGKFGFKQEVVRREAFQRDNRYWDEIVLGLEKGGK